MRTVSDLALANNGELDAVLRSGFPGENRTVEEQLTHLIATIGENMSVRRMASLSVNNGVVSSYIHTAAAPGLGRIGVILALESEGDTAALETLGKQLAMHVAAANPEAVTEDEVDADLVARERTVQVDKARESGRPEEIIEKMVEGRMRKFFEDVALLSQTYVIDGESKVAQVLEAQAKELGKPIKIVGFVRFELGDGIEKDEGDFAAEVASMAG